MKKIIWNVILAMLALGTVIILIVYGFSTKSVEAMSYSDGIEQIDLNNVYLSGSKTTVHFDEVLLSSQEETRKLIVSKQTGTVSTQMTSKMIEKLDFDFLKKTQNVSYTGNGYFVVDLSGMTKEDIVQDTEAKTLTIRIDHAYLEIVEIDPEKIMIDDVQEGLLARGDIMLSVRDVNALELELQKKLKNKFNTSQNGQEADQIALRMVKAVYEPVVKAIDDEYEVLIEFK